MIRIIDALDTWNPAMWSGLTGMSFALASMEHWLAVVGALFATLLPLAAVIVTLRKT